MKRSLLSLGVLAMGLLAGCRESRPPAPAAAVDNNPPGSTNTIQKITRSDAEWQKRLTSQQYHITRERGTERAFSGQFWDNHEPGIYRSEYHSKNHTVGCRMAEEAHLTAVSHHPRTRH